ncbi:unnamed protein product [Adineta steineri]|uniref:NHL repeat containing protein n=1 Tax=Adineta steineri TaxID=433720 RepID=A0A814HR57_9BILA|nr:unnamed protein product [Adineta steineri]CAF3758745.1 unnamed protein product [Adineta steineri]
MDNNNTDIIDVQSINFDTTQPSTSQSRTSCECFRRRKLMWIILASIVTVLIILGIIIPTIIIKTKKIQIEEISTMETTTETTITITEIIATKKETTATTIETITEPLTTTEQKTTTEKQLFSSIDNNIDIIWIQNGITVAGGYRPTSKLDGFNSPSSIYIDDDDQTMYIGDSGNSRVVEWKYGAKIGQVVAGGNGMGSQMNQFKSLIDVVFDKKNNVFITCDYDNKRVVQWFRENLTDQQILIPDIFCRGLAMSNDGLLYVSRWGKDDVIRWKLGEKDGETVAGGNELDQLSWPLSIFVDQDHSVYVTDGGNADGRVTKWLKDTKFGIVVASQGEVNSPIQSFEPSAVFVDHLDNTYVADSRNHRIIRWLNASRKGDIIVGGNGKGNRSNQLSNPSDLSFDRYGNLYVVDQSNHRIQKFDIVVN